MIVVNNNGSEEYYKTRLLYIDVRSSVLSGRDLVVITIDNHYLTSF